MTPDAGVLGWVVASLVGIIATAFAAVFAWLFKVHLPLKETQFQALLAQAKAEREATEVGRAAERALVDANREVEREKDRNLRHELSNQFQIVVQQILQRHEVNSEKDRTAFEHRSTEATQSLRLAVEAQTHAFERALEHWAKDITNAMSTVCEAGTHFPKRRRNEPGTAPEVS